MQQCRGAIVVDRQDGMARKLTPRARCRLAKSSSFNQKGQRKFGTFLAAGALLLLACVLCLEIRLSGVRNYGEDSPDAPDDKLLNTDVHREHADFQKRLFEGKSASNLVSAGRRMEEEAVQEGRGEGSRQLGDDGLDNVDELEREVQSVSLDTSSRAALLRRKADRDRLDLESRFVDIDEAKLEDLEAELDMENDELEEFESFGGDFLNELDELSLNELKDDKTDDMDDSDFGNENEEAGTSNKSVAVQEENAGELQSKTSLQEGLRSEQGGGDGQRAEVLKDEAREMEERERGDDAGAGITSKGGKRLERLGHIKTLPRSENSLQHVSGRRLGDVGRSAPKGTSLRGHPDKEAANRYSSRSTDKMQQFLWDHVLGVSKKPLKEADGEPSSSDPQLPKTSSKHIFSTDDEPLDDQLRSRVDEIVDIEDAFLLNSPKLFKAPKNSGKKISDSDAARKDGGVAIDLLNPLNNPLLTDPDSLDTGGLTKNDRAILRALRRSSLNEVPESLDQSILQLPAKKPLEDKVTTASIYQEKNAPTQRNLAEKVDVGLKDERAEMIPESRGMLAGEDGVAQKPFRAGARTISSYEAKKRSLKLLLESPGKQVEPCSQSDGAGSGVVNGRIPERTLSASQTQHHLLPASSNLAIPPPSHRLPRGRSFCKRREVEVGRRWGRFPGIDPSLSFSAFMDQFLADKYCTLRVFMVWTTPPWTYSVRYQRGLESLLHFHPQACVVVFSEAVDSDMFEGFVQDGYRVAAVNPNLNELLNGTPSDVLASVSQCRRNIHCSELLRLAALYRYGGLYLDSDVLVLKPLTDLRNTVRGTFQKDCVRRLDGAVMAFDRASPFLNECLREFTVTYDDKHLKSNGGGLLTRVAKRYRGAPVEIQPPSAFSPLQSTGIQRFFSAPKSRSEHERHSHVLEKILRESFTLHF